MLKRLVNIVLAAWLINALICYHPLSPEKFSLAATNGALSEAHADNTLVDIFCNHLGKHKPHKPQNHQGHSKSRYVFARATSLNMIFPCNSNYPLFYAGLLLLAPTWVLWKKKKFLPPYHHFLFRLSPF